MKPVNLIPLFALMALSAGPIAAQDDKTPTTPPAPSPGEIAAAAPASDWKDIAASDLLVMKLAPDANGKPRNVLIQLMPAPFSQGWVSNIRALAKDHYWDGLAIYRVQDNYVTQWGDPEDDEKKARKKPEGLKEMPESDYVTRLGPVTLSGPGLKQNPILFPDENAAFGNDAAPYEPVDYYAAGLGASDPPTVRVLDGTGDGYSRSWGFANGWPVAVARGVTNKAMSASAWPTHCYGMVGVARGQRPSTGDGSTLYTVIGHAPRHLDRNIALAGRVIEGMEFLSSLPRGPAPSGFYADAAMQVPIVSVRLASELPAAEQPHVQYLSTDSASFLKYADARANRSDPFFLVPAGGADICNIPVPIRRRP